MYKFIQCMRWLGPDDPVSLSDIRQAGCSGVATALYDIPAGGVWSRTEILKRKKLIEEAGLRWEVAENLPVHECIKTQSGNFEECIFNYQKSIRNLSSCGIHTITYNFSPLLEWTRTDLDFTLPDGSKTHRYEKSALVAFDLFMLKREHAEKDYRKDEIQKAEQRFHAMSPDEKNELQKIIIGDFETAEFRSMLEPYRRMNIHRYRQYLFFFLQEVLPVADECNVKMALHPDDPPYTIFGLPRISGTAPDLEFIFEAVPSMNNGLCFCTGSLGVRKNNNLPLMVKQFAKRIHFVHMNNIHRHNRDFWEMNHLDGSIDMYDVMKELIYVMQKREVAIPIRPDHGLDVLLAELRGLELGIQRTLLDSM